jgi:hypothetical protein
MADSAIRTRKRQTKGKQKGGIIRHQFFLVPCNLFKMTSNNPSLSQGAPRLLGTKRAYPALEGFHQRKGDRGEIEITGREKEKQKGMTLIKDGRKLALPVYHQDELSKFFG